MYCYRETPGVKITHITGVVHTGKIDELLETQFRIIPKQLSHGKIIRSGDHNSNLATGINNPDGSLTKFLCHQLSQKLELFSHDGLHSTCDRVFTLDLVLKLNNPVQQSFGSRGTPRHINIDRYNSVTTANHRV